MKPDDKKYRTMVRGEKRKAFIGDGGYDGRYLTKVVKSKKQYNRNKLKQRNYEQED